MLTFVTRKRSVFIFLKTKTTSSHKVIYFKRNKLYKIWLCIFFPMLVENIEFKVTKKTYIQVTTILLPRKKKQKNRTILKNCSKQFCQPSVVSLTFIIIKYHSLVFYINVLLKPISLRLFFFSVSLSCVESTWTTVFF